MAKRPFLHWQHPVLPLVTTSILSLPPRRPNIRPARGIGHDFYAELGLGAADLRGSSGGDDSESDDAESDDAADSTDETPADDSAGEAGSDAAEDADQIATDGTYTVQRGDTLASIAARLGIDGGWRTLHEVNADEIGDPALIFSGEELALPASADAAAADADLGQSSSNSGTYRVKTGDTLSRIAKEQSVAGGWPSLHDVNSDIVANPNVIVTGQVLDLP